MGAFAESSAIAALDLAFVSDVKSSLFDRYTLLFSVDRQQIEVFPGYGRSRLLLRHAGRDHERWQTRGRH